MVPFSLADPDGQKDILGTTIMQRTAQPAEVAGAVPFLASNEASYMTGSEMVVDGIRQILQGVDRGKRDVLGFEYLCPKAVRFRPDQRRKRSLDVFGAGRSRRVIVKFRIIETGQARGSDQPAEEMSFNRPYGDELTV